MSPCGALEQEIAERVCWRKYVLALALLWPGAYSVDRSSDHCHHSATKTLRLDSVVEGMIDIVISATSKLTRRTQARLTSVMSEISPTRLTDQAGFVYIHRLPNEVLSHIMCLGMPPSIVLGDSSRVPSPQPALQLRAYLSNIIYVCRLWHLLAISTPGLWTMLYYDPTQDQGWFMNSFLTFLARSKNLPIFVHLENNDFRRRGFQTTTRMSIISEAIRQHSQRIESLVLVNAYQLLWPKHARLDALKALDITIGPDELPFPEDMHLVSSIAIRAKYSHNSSIDSLFRSWLSPSALKAVTLSHCTWVDYQDILQQCSDLEQLALCACIFPTRVREELVSLRAHRVRFEGDRYEFGVSSMIYAANVVHLEVAVQYNLGEKRDDDDDDDDEYIDSQYLHTEGFHKMLSFEVDFSPRWHPIELQELGYDLERVLGSATSLRVFRYRGRLDLGRFEQVLWDFWSNNPALLPAPALRHMQFITPFVLEPQPTFALGSASPKDGELDALALLRRLLSDRPLLSVDIAAELTRLDKYRVLETEFPGRVLLREPSESDDGPSQRLEQRRDLWSDIL